MGMGVHVSSCNTTGFSSIQTTGSVVDNGLSYNPSTSSMRAMYSSSSFATVAVGTAIAGRPPHRSVRAELPHTAPALDASACHQGRRPTHCSWYLENAESGSESGTFAHTRNSPWRPPFPPSPPQRLSFWGRAHCSATSSVLWQPPTPRDRTRGSCGMSLHPPDYLLACAGS